MEKRLVAAIVLTVVFLFLYTSLIRPPADAPVPAEELPVAGQDKIEAPEPPSAREPQRAAPPAPAAERRDTVVDTELYRAVFSSSGAGIRSFRLKKHAERWKTDEEIEREISSLENRLSRTTSEILKIRTRMQNNEDASRLARLEEREQSIKQEQESLEFSLLIMECLKTRLAERKSRITQLEQKIGAASPGRRAELEDELAAEKGVELIPPEASCFEKLAPSIVFPSLNIDLSALNYVADKNYLKVNENNKSVTFTASPNDGAIISKTFEFSNESYAVDFRFTVENRTGRTLNEQNMGISYFPGVGLMESAPGRGVVTGIVSFIDGTVQTDRIAAGRSDLEAGTPKLRAGEHVWTAIKGKYFTAAIIPGFRHCVLAATFQDPGGKRIEARHPEIVLRDGDIFTADAVLYLGPQSPEELAKAHETLVAVIDYGFWSPVAKIIDRLLKVFYGAFNNFGVAIIFLALTVKIVFYPLTRKSFIAMKKMQDDMKAIQPKINELKKKYGNNQQKLNKATMELYKKEGVNPMSGCRGGCFPMLLQMPVFFALYAVLNTSIELRGAHFAGWITDLSLPDPYRILPVLMGVSMFWQQKQTGGGGAGPQQEQAKMMQWMMPVMLTFIFFGLPSGIVLYWFSFNIFTSIQQMLIKKHGA